MKIKHRWPQQTILKARQMRLTGMSFGKITKELGVAKSTLHSWVSDIVRPVEYRNQKEWLKKIQPMAVAAIKKKRQEEIDDIVQYAKKEVASWSFLHDKEVQKAFLSLLYWAEGQKLPERGSPVKFANTDPRMILLFVTLLKQCYSIDLKKIKVSLYLHWYHNETKVKMFWKKLLDVDESQFRKVYWKRRSKTKRFRKNFMGICFIIYHDVNLRQEIVHIAYSLQELLAPSDLLRS